jgi:DNA-binding transcriptional LysR family regulator
MRRLEAELGVQLLERHSRGVEVTAAGELFLKRARFALAATDVAAATGHDLEAGVLGTLRVGVADAAAWPPASAFLQQFSRERPRIELSVLQASSGALWRDLRDRRLDALLTPVGGNPGDMRALDLGAGEWVALIGKGHPLAGIGPIPVAQLDGERIAVTGHRDGAAFDEAVASLLGEFGVVAELVSGAPWPAAHAAVTGNDLVGLTTTPPALPPGVLARPLEPRRTLSFDLLWRDEVPSPALAGFIDAAAAQAQIRPSTAWPAAVA